MNAQEGDSRRVGPGANGVVEFALQHGPFAEQGGVHVNQVQQKILHKPALRLRKKQVPFVPRSVPRQVEQEGFDIGRLSQVLQDQPDHGGEKITKSLRTQKGRRVPPGVSQLLQPDGFRGFVFQRVFMFLAFAAMVRIARELFRGGAYLKQLSR